MTLQTMNLIKNKEKSTPHKNSSPMLNGTEVYNGPDFPMKPFKGTKSHLEEPEETAGSSILKPKKKRKANLDDEEMHLKKDKKLKYDPSKVMSKLEQFSDVWNDCPDVENPKSSFEIVPNQINEFKIFNKDNKQVEKKISRSSSKTTDEIKLPILNKSGKVHSWASRSNEENKYHDNINSFDKKKTFKTKNTSSKFKDKVSEQESANTGKYDSNLAEMKRKKAVQEQSQLHADQKNIIKKALMSMDGKQQINKKIVFSDAEDNEESETKVETKSDKTKNKKLFEDDDSLDGDIELKVNSQFEGKKGQKLLELQSKFASDSRFSLDSRFHDSESEDEKEEAPTENLDIEEEKKRQLEILESIVKQPIRPLSETRKFSSKRYDDSLMVRFDPTREDHEKYLLKPQKQEKETVEKKVKKSKKASKSSLDSEESKPEVSKEKVYAVKDDLKEVLRKENKPEFSLLKLFGSKDEDSTTQQEDSENVKKLKYATKNPFKYDSSESESEEESIVETKDKNKDAVKPPGPRCTLPSWRTTFFFTDNDSRYKEAQEFLRVPEEHEGNQEFTEKRKMLKDFIRHKLKNSNRKKDPFKKKLGGVKKKKFHSKNGK